jgi:hypothetical protein
MTSAPVALIIIANGFIGASLGMIIFTAAIRGIPEHLFSKRRPAPARRSSARSHSISTAVARPLVPPWRSNAGCR